MIRLRLKILISLFRITDEKSGRLIPSLLDAGYRVRAMGRNLEKLSCRPWAGHHQVEIVQGDVLNPDSLKKAVSGCRVAYYLIHSMIARGEKYSDLSRLAGHLRRRGTSCQAYYYTGSRPYPNVKCFQEGLGCEEGEDTLLRLELVMHWIFGGY